jgi:S-formylglutathione hydrolase FrmB
MPVMALLHTHFFSEVLGLQCTMDVLLPQKPSRPALPVLWLLHGLSDDHSIWQRRTSIERYADGLDLAVLMPNVHRSFYTDMRHGLPYERFIADELPVIARHLFHLSARREETFVAGLSMGGYGAFKLALKYPGRYAAAASLSGALDMASRWDRGERIGEMELVYGGSPAGTPNDLMFLARQLAADPAQPRPRLFQCCGTEDFLLDDNRAFRDQALGLGLDLVYREAPGNHTWAFWDTHIQQVLAWLADPQAGTK